MQCRITTVGYSFFVVIFLSIDVACAQLPSTPSGTENHFVVPFSESQSIQNRFKLIRSDDGILQGYEWNDSFPVIQAISESFDFRLVSHNNHAPQCDDDLAGKFQCSSAADSSDTVRWSTTEVQFQYGELIYFGVGLQDPDRAVKIARRRWPKVRLPSVRGCEASVTALPAIWADIDVAGPGHSSSALPPDEQSALGLLRAIPVPPSYIVHTGGGYHVYWVFHEPWVLETSADREQAGVPQRLPERRRLRTSPTYLGL